MTKRIILSIVLALVFSTVIIIFKNNLGSFYDTILSVLNVVGSIFVRLLKFSIIPIVIFSLIGGMLSLDSIKQLKILGFKTILLFATTTLIALFFAITTANLLDIGSLFNNSLDVLSITKVATTSNPTSIANNIIMLVPDNFISPMLSTNMIQVVILAILIGSVMLAFPINERKNITSFVITAEKISVGIVNIIMKLAPYAIFALLSRAIIMQGVDIVWAMLQYALTMLLVLVIHSVIVYLPLIKLSGLKISQFFKAAGPAIAVAFSTSSSNATLPYTLKAAEDLKIPKAVAGFVLPLGSTLHMNGTAIMQGVAIVFLANIYNVELSFMEYVGAALLAVVATMGAAGIPGSGLVTLTLVLIQYNIPIEGIGIILGIDRIMDMTRTTVNISGDIIVAALLSKNDRVG